MRPYLAVLSARFRMLLQYRSAALAGFATQLFWGLLRIMIFSAFFAGTSQPQPMTLGMVITYTWLTQASLTMFPWNVDAEILQMVRTGTIAYELVRPVSLFWLWFWRALATRSAPMVLRGMPMLILAWLLFGLQPPRSPAAALAGGLAMFCALLLSSAISTALNVSLLFTISGEGVNRFLPGLVMIFSGLIIPLPFFPDSWQTFLNVQPFCGLLDLPFRLYTGHLSAAGVGWVVFHQLGWTLFILALTGFFLDRALSRLVVQGG